MQLYTTCLHNLFFKLETFAMDICLVKTWCFLSFAWTLKQPSRETQILLKNKGNGIKSFPECQPLAKGHQIKHYPLQKEHHTHSRFKVSRFIFVNWDDFSNAVWCLFQAAGRWLCFCWLCSFLIQTNPTMIFETA